TLRTKSLTGNHSIQEREQAVQLLEEGKLDYLITVDIFNEGVDIPAVNQVVMMRQTKSSIIFTQQLGRGLRKAAGKEHLIVIDFIGNYTNNYLIPIALFGDNSLSKDSIRKNLLDAKEAGVISGVSSVNFDEISRKRIFDSIEKSKLDSMQNLKRVFSDLEHRLGHIPQLIDFARFDTADPVVVSTKSINYWNFLVKIKKTNKSPSLGESAILAFMSKELLNGKRPHELLLLKHLLQHKSITRSEYKTILRSKYCTHDDETINSVSRVLDLTFFTEVQRKLYGNSPIVEMHDDTFHVSDQLSANYEYDYAFKAHLDDAIETGLYLARHKYGWPSSLKIGHRYSRKDVCRILNWASNQEGTIFGYKVDFFSASCPIFITYHKDEDVSHSTRYEDELLNSNTLKWFTRSRRTLGSKEVKSIINNEVPQHLFAKKDDAEGLDFFYLGEVRSSNPVQTTMLDDHGHPLDVVTMHLNLEKPLTQSLYDYLTTPTIA
ncbi:MAG TPA: DUF3427 domain-containing protein, partial [Microbacteriaceae bacterium]|nr:DUF3427 domain-containing protein [Microbacteriaceae bacterium]